MTREFAALAKLYSLHEVTGDAYSAAWVVASWRDNGISYVPAVRNKSTLYLEALPCWTRGAVRIPEHAQLLRELRLLERRVSRVGRDLIDTRNGSDDHANVVCGVVALLAGTSTYASDLRWVDGDGDGPEAAMDAWRRLELQSNTFCAITGEERCRSECSRITDKNGKRREVSEGIYRQLFGDDADVIEDGERVTVPLRMRDGQPPAD